MAWVMSVTSLQSTAMQSCCTALHFAVKGHFATLCVCVYVCICVCVYVCVCVRTCVCVLGGGEETVLHSVFHFILILIVHVFAKNWSIRAKQPTNLLWYFIRVFPVVYRGAVNTTVPDKPTLDTAQAWNRLVHLHLLLDRTSIRILMPSSLQTCHLSARLLGTAL